jgi:hypothetical protein
VVSRVVVMPASVLRHRPRVVLRVRDRGGMLSRFTNTNPIRTVIRMTFVQIIEFDTDRQQELEGVMDEWLAATEGKRTMLHEFHTRDRENSSHFVDIVEFPSYEQAMVNSNLPETQRISDKMRALCKTEPRFMNLDVIKEYGNNR